MKAHIVGVPTPFVCECKEQFVLATWKKPPLQEYFDIDFVMFPGELPYCPFCGGKGGVTRKEFV